MMISTEKLARLKRGLCKLFSKRTTAPGGADAGEETMDGWVDGCVDGPELLREPGGMRRVSSDLPASHGRSARCPSANSSRWPWGWEQRRYVFISLFSGYRVGRPEEKGC